MQRVSEYGLDRLRIVIFAPDPTVRRWIRVELNDVVHDEYVIDTVAVLCSQLSASMEEPVDAAIVDFDAMTSADIAQLARARRSGFSGRLVALGRVPAEVASRLDISVVLGRPFGSEALRTAIERLADDRAERVTEADR